MWKKTLLILFAALGIAGFCAVAALAGVEETWKSVRNVGFGCVAAYFAACLGTLVFPALGWHLLLRAENVRLSLFDTLRANVMGFPVNFITPSMYLGSEPLKVFYISGISGASKRAVLATVIVSKFQELVGLSLGLVLCAIYFAWNTTLIDIRSEALLLITTLVLAALLGLVFYAIVGDFRPTVRFINLLARLGVAKRKLARLRSRADEMEQMIRDAFTRRWRRFLLAQFLTLLSSVTLLLRPVLFFRFLPGAPALPLEHLAGIFLVTNLANLFTIAPGSLGFYDGGVTAYFKLAADLRVSDGHALTVVNRICDLILLIAGSWLIVRHGLLRIARGKEKVDLDPPRGGNPERAGS